MSDGPRAEEGGLSALELARNQLVLLRAHLLDPHGKTRGALAADIDEALAGLAAREAEEKLGMAPERFAEALLAKALGDWNGHYEAPKKGGPSYAEVAVAALLAYGPEHGVAVTPNGRLWALALRGHEGEKGEVVDRYWSPLYRLVGPEGSE